MTSNMIYIVTFGGGLKCPRKIHLNTQCPPPLFFPVQIGLIIFGLSISADLLQQRCSSGPAVAGTTAQPHCSNSNNCHCCYPKRDQTGTKLLPMLPLILEHGSDSSSSAVCSGQVTTRSRPTSMVIAGEFM